MVCSARWILAVGTFLSISMGFTAFAGDKEEVVHPLYKHWAKFKPGTTVTHVEKTVFSGAEKTLAPDGVEKKQITYNLFSVTAANVVVEVVVAEHEFLGTIVSAPTKKIFPAKITKANL